MHEFHLIKDLMRKITEICHENGAEKVLGVKVRIGALAHITPDHFREHFEQAAVGTVADGASLDATLNPDENDPQAQDILLLSVEVEE
ncbi:MAG: hydrogenase/urease maturation nickel metallochaperone HypA [Verrucomicrobiales bacterium]|nr:hydrogenase maturation nickel metallochaperone HypA [Verrucomicrobiota bacterium JB025]